MTGIGLRLGLLLVAMAGSACVHLGFRHHLASTAPLRAGELAETLGSLPHQLGDWTGEDREIQDERWRYGDSHLQRVYRHPLGGEVLVWMVYSKTGRDRSHHPEICMAVAGQAEDSRRRGEVRVDEGAAIQRFAYGRDLGAQQVFYWYYTLASEEPPGLSGLQRLYAGLQQRPASLSVEVFVPDQPDLPEARLLDLIRDLDRAAGGVAGPRGVRGSRRLSVIPLPAAAT